MSHLACDGAGRGSPREEAFHQIQPGSAGRGEVPVIAGVRGKPGLHRRVGVGAIVVEDQMDRQSARCGALDPLKQAQKLLMAMAWHAVAQHLTAQYVQGREQSRGSMAGVIVRLPLGDSRTEGQNRLGTVQGLDLALLIHAQHQSFLRRIQVQADNVVQLVKEPGIGAQLEALYAMRLQTMRLPDAIDGRRTYPLGSGQRAYAPLRRSGWAASHMAAYYTANFAYCHVIYETLH